MRKIKKCGYSIKPVTVSAEFARDAPGWLAGKASEHSLSTLLGHADDGVIWGWLDGGVLRTSDSAFPDVSPPLREVTLHQARLFGPDAELLVWRDGEGNWQARLLRDEPECDEGWRFDEAQILWGDHADGDGRKDFTLVADGSEGLRHAVPRTGVRFAQAGMRPLRLGVRHYLEEDEDGMLTIVHSRLTDVWADGEKEESNG